MAKSFEEYLRDAQAQGLYKPPASSPAPQQPKRDIFGDLSGVAATRAEETSPLTPLKTAIDLISRPEYAVTGALAALGRTELDARAGKNEGSLLDYLGAAAEGAAKGFTSTDPGDQYTGAELLQQMGVEDDFTKGVGGFGLDIALDPLTYLSGGIVSLVGKGAKGAKALLTGAKDVEKAAEAGSPLAKAAVAEDAIDNAKAARLRAAMEEDLPAEDMLAGSRSNAARAETSAAPALGDMAQPAARAAAPRAGDLPASLTDDIAGASLPGLRGLVEQAPVPPRQTVKPQDVKVELPDIAAGERSQIQQAMRAAPVDETPTPMSRPEGLDVLRQIMGEVRQAPGMARVAAGVQQLDDTRRLGVTEAAGVAPEQAFRAWRSENLNTVVPAATPGGKPRPVREWLDRFARNADNPEIRQDAFQAVRQAFDASPAGKSFHERVVGEQVRTGQGFKDYAETMRAMNLGERWVDDTFPPEVASLLKQTAGSNPQRFERLMGDLVRGMGGGAKGTWFLDADPGLARRMLQASNISAVKRQRAMSTATHLAQMAWETSEKGRLGSTARVWRRWANRQVRRGETHTYDIGAAKSTSPKRGVGTAYYEDEINTFGQWERSKFINDAYFGKNSPQRREWLEYVRLKGRDPNRLFGADRARLMLDFRIEKMRQLDEIDDVYGYRSQLRIGPGNDALALGDNRVPLSIGDVYSILRDASLGTSAENAMLRTLQHWPTSVAPTQLLLAVLHKLDGFPDDVVREVILSSRKAGVLGQSDVPEKAFLGNNLANGARTDMTHLVPNKGLPMSTFRKQLEAKLQPGQKLVESSGGKGFFVQHSPEALANELMAVIEQATPLLRAKAIDNAEAFARRSQQETRELTQRGLANLDKIVSEGTDGELLDAIVHRRAEMHKRARENATYQASTQSALNIQEELIRIGGDDLIPTAQRWNLVRTELERRLYPAIVEAQRGSNAFGLTGKHGGTRTVVALQKRQSLEVDAVTRTAQVADDEEVLRMFQDAQQVGKEQFSREMIAIEEAIDASGDAAAAAADDVLVRAEEWLDLAGRTSAATTDLATARLLDPFRKLFVQNHGMETIHPRLFKNMQNAGQYVAMKKRKLMDAAKLVGVRANGNVVDSPLPVAFSNLQRGIVANDELGAVAKAYADVLSDIFPSGGANAMSSVVFRNSQDVDLINDMLARNGLKGRDIGFADAAPFDWERAVRKAEAKGTRPMDEVMEQWRDWKVDDPMVTLAKVVQTAADIAERRAMVADFKVTAERAGFMSTKPQPGYVKIVSQGDTTYGGFLDALRGPAGETLYFPKELASELKVADEFMRAPKQAQNRLMREYYLPALNTWKWAITLPRPGHHIRNMIGDWSIQTVARGVRHFAVAQQDAVKILGTNAKYDGVDILQSLERRPGDALPKGGDTLVRSDKYGDFTVDELFGALNDNGLRPSYVAGEGLFDDEITQKTFARVLEKATIIKGTRLGEKIGEFSEYRDHFARAGHFMQALRQEVARGRYKTREELISAVAKEVRKYHPDSTMLTAFESRYMRNIIPFYSWFRGVLPAIFESSWRHPNRVMWFPKASYGLAQTQGIDPQSFANPFPDDQLFPSFLSDQMLGPQFQLGDGTYLGMNPGISHLDVFDTLGGSDPVRGILGMVSPLIRVPAELAGNSKWQTGQQIKDTSDYLDSSIPGLNYVANVSGYSPTGSIASLIMGQGLDPQEQVSRGVKGGLDQALSAGNWLSGLGVQNMSRENYQTIAEIEKRNREGQAANGR